MVVARRGALSARRGIGRGGISGPALFAHGNKGRGCWRGAGSRVHEFEQTDQGEEARLTETQPGADRRCSVALRWPGADSAAQRRGRRVSHHGLPHGRPALRAKRAAGARSAGFCDRPGRARQPRRSGCDLPRARPGRNAAMAPVRRIVSSAVPCFPPGAALADAGSRGLARPGQDGAARAGWHGRGRTVGVQGPGVCRCGFTGRAAGKRFFPAGPVTGPGLSVGCGSSVAASCAEGGAGAVRHRRPAMAAVACVTIDRLRVQPNGRSGPGACRGSAGDARTGLRGGRDEPPERAEPQGAVAHPEEKRSDETGKSQQAPARQERRRRQ